MVFCVHVVYIVVHMGVLVIYLFMARVCRPPVNDAVISGTREANERFVLAQLNWTELVAVRGSSRIHTRKSPFLRVTPPLEDLGPLSPTVCKKGGGRMFSSLYA